MSHTRETGKPEFVDFHVADPGLVNPQMDQFKDALSWQFDVEPVGYESP